MEGESEKYDHQWLMSVLTC